MRLTSTLKGSNRNEAVSELCSVCPSSAYRPFIEEFLSDEKGVTSLLVISWYSLPCAPLISSSCVYITSEFRGQDSAARFCFVASQTTARPLSSTCPTPRPNASCHRKLWSPDYLTALLGSLQAFWPFLTEFESALGGPCKSTFTSYFHQERGGIITRLFLWATLCSSLAVQSRAVFFFFRKFLAQPHVLFYKWHNYAD